MTVARVVVTIDELVLHGIAARDRCALAEALQDELGRLLLAEGLPQNWRRGAALDELRASAALPAWGGAALKGRAVAGAVHRSLIASAAPAPGAMQGGRR